MFTVDTAISTSNTYRNLQDIVPARLTIRIVRSAIVNSATTKLSSSTAHSLPNMSTALLAARILQTRTLANSTTPVHRVTISVAVAISCSMIRLTLATTSRAHQACTSCAPGRGVVLTVIRQQRCGNTGSSHAVCTHARDATSHSGQTKGFPSTAELRMCVNSVTNTTRAMLDSIRYVKPTPDSS